MKLFIPHTTYTRMRIKTATNQFRGSNIEIDTCAQGLTPGELARRIKKCGEPSDEAVLMKQNGLRVKEYEETVQ